MSTLRPFEAAVRLGSFKAAAEELHLTQSAISHQISSLENHFHAKLFVRQGNRLVLTKDGSAYGATVVKLLAELSRAGELLSEKVTDGVLRVSASPSFAMFAALAYADEFKAKNASMDLRLESRNTDVDFDMEAVDAAIQVGGPPFPGLQSHRLFQSRLRPLAHKSLREKYAPIRTAGDLARMPLIELNNVPGLWTRWFAKTDRRVRVGELRLSSDSLLAAVQMAESGVGVILAPFPLLTSLVSAGRLEILVRECLTTDRPDFHLLYRRRDAGSPKIKAIRSWLNHVVANMESRANAAGL
jgi:LysR family transcriptional regulator, glycine cleavage system transcriptional activator